MGNKMTWDEWIATRGKAVVAGGVVISDPEGRILMIRPTYFKGWQVPGGGSDPGEFPWETAVRETWEETGIKVDLPYGHIVSMPPKLVAMDFYPRVAGGEKREDAPSDIHFFFAGPVVTEQEVSKVIQLSDEHDAWQFVDRETAASWEGLGFEDGPRFIHVIDALREGRFVMMAEGKPQM